MDGGIDYEAEYDNRARVPEHPAIIAGWAREAEAARAELRCDLGVPYGPDPRQAFDLFHPQQAREGAAVMFVHGGYWRAFDRDSFSHMARGVMAHGLAVAVPGYRLCPSVRIADIIDDIRAAVRRLHALTGKRIVVAGHSAGGHLAAAMLATDWPALDPSLPADLVPAAYAVSGLFELEPLIHTSVNAALRMDEEEARAASPLLWPAPSGRSLDAVVGGLESGEYLRQSRRIATEWGEAGVVTRLEILPGRNHFTAIAPLADPDSEMTARLTALALEAG